MNTFRKEEKLKSNKIIDQIFLKREGIVEYPFRFFWIENEGLQQVYPVQICITVSKKNHRKAVSRNYIKRVVRELYRNNKSELSEYLQRSNQSLALCVIYMSRTIHPFEFLQANFVKGLKEIIRFKENKISNETILKKDAD